jgi:hypothetical protein
MHNCIRIVLANIICNILMHLPRVPLYKIQKHIVMKNLDEKIADIKQPPAIAKQFALCVVAWQWLRQQYQKFFRAP